MTPQRSTSIREDTELVPPEPPAEIPDLGAPAAGLAIASPAGPHGLLIEGERTTVVGSQSGVIERILIDGRAVARNLEAGSGPVANVVSWPGLVRRERIGPRGISFESALAAPTLPLVVVQWGPSEAPPPDSISLELAAPRDSTFRVERGSCAIVDGDGHMIAVGVSPGPVGIEASDGDPGHLTVRIRPAPAGTTTLLVAAGTPAAVTQAFAAARHLASHARIARDASLEDGMSLVTGVGEIDDGFHWARIRLRAALSREAADATHQRALWASLAALAVGDERAAADGFRAAQREDPFVSAVVAGLISTTFGKARQALATAEMMLGQGLTPANFGAAGAGWRRFAFESLAKGLHNAASADMIEALEAAGSSLLSDRPAGSVVRLPVVGQAAGTTELTSWLPSLLAGEPEARTPTEGSEEEALLYRLSAGFRADPDAAWLEWRESIGQGLTTGPAGPGSWDGPTGSSGHVAPATAALLIGLGYGLLGYSPDAHTGRIRLAPRLPSHLTRFVMRGVTGGRARLTLGYERDGRAHRFTLEPTVASVPPTVVFEPSVSGAVTEVRIDGAAADLETRRNGDRTLVPVQLPVDTDRSVEIVTE